MKITKDNEPYDLLINRKTDIACSQETHSKPDTIQKWKKEWKWNSIWHSGTISNESGVVILFKENSDIEVINTHKDKHGQILQCSIKFEQEIFQLINIYAPTKPANRKNFYNKLRNFIKYDEKTILASDFSMIENIFLDRLDGNLNNTHSIGIQSLNFIKNKHELIDIW